MENDAPICVIGFPKSGNTWLLRMLCDACGANINQDDDVNTADSDANRKRLLHKIHFAEPSSLPASAKIIYIARDIRDVLVSAFFFNNPFISEDGVLLGGGRGIRQFFLRSYFRRQVRRTNMHWCGNELVEMRNWLKNKPAKTAATHNWSSHVTYWSSRPDVCFVKYEDLVSDTYAVMEKTLDFLGMKCNETDVKNIVRQQSFGNKKRQFQQQGDSTNARFLRRGQPGDWVRFLDDQLVDEIIRVNGKALRALGYLDGAGLIAGNGAGNDKGTTR